MPKLQESEIRSHLSGLPSWSFQDNALHCKFKFDSFMPGIRFVNRIAEAAEQAQHHPDITINYNVITISLSTHSEGGVTSKDVDLARQIDDLARS